MDITINFGTVALRYSRPIFRGIWTGVFVWDGSQWVPWEDGSDEEQEAIRAKVRQSPLEKTMPDVMRQVMFPEPRKYGANEGYLSDGSIGG